MSEYFRVPRSYVEIDCTHLVPIQICDSCGCLHRNISSYTCESCQIAIIRVKIEQAKARFCAGRLGVPYESKTARRYVVMSGSNMGKTGGDFTRQQVEDALRPLGWISIAPDLGDFARSLAEQVALRLDIPVDVLLARIPEPLPPIGFSRGNDFSDILRQYGADGPRSDEPVMQRNKRNKGPAPVGKWWNGPRRF